MTSLQPLNKLIILRKKGGVKTETRGIIQRMSLQYLNKMTAIVKAELRMMGIIVNGPM
jgi:hypothetical protein